MPLIQITNTYTGPVLDLVESCVPVGFTIRTLPENTEAALLALVPDADYILASGQVRIGPEVLAAAKRLKMIQRTGVGLDSLDLDAIRAAGIPLYVNKGVNARSVAEHAVLLILACLRRLTLLDRNTKDGIWRKQAQGITTFELAGKTVGLIGLGSIGRIAASLLRPFGADLIYYDMYRPDPAVEAELGLTYLEREEVLRRADILSLHCPLTEETRDLIRAETLAMMKDGAVIVNTARGGLIREPDLLAALESGKIAFAGLDVHAAEPIPAGDPLTASGRVIATPHVGGVTYDAFRRMMEEAMGNMARFEAGDLDAIRPSRYL